MGEPLVARLVLWSLADSTTDVAELRRELRAGVADSYDGLPGLLFRAWVSDEVTERFGAFELWASKEASEQELPARERDLIGKPPEILELFDLEATVSVADELAQLGLALE